MTTTTPAPGAALLPAGPLWVNDSGEIACSEHGGAYLKFGVQGRPRARVHQTPLGTWRRLTADALTELAADFTASGLPAPACEGCPPTTSTPAPTVAPEVEEAAPTHTRREVHCEDCGHPVNERRAGTCTAKGHRVSVVDLTVTTFNSVRALPFTAAPAPYLGHTPKG